MTTPLHLTVNIKARTQNPRYSPDGTKISYLAMNRPGLESDNLHIEIYDTLTNTVRKITDTLDRSVIDYTWYDGTTIIFTCTDINVNKLYAVNLNSPSDFITLLNTGYYFLNNSLMTINNEKGLLLVQRSSYNPPDELSTFYFDFNSRKLVSSINRLFNVNIKNLNQFKFNEAEPYDHRRI